MAYRVRGVVLPEREERTFWIDGETLRTEPIAGAETLIDGGWLVPGLVDAHTHPGSEQAGDPFTEEKLRQHLVAHRDAGVLLLRAPGSAERIPAWVDDDPELPRIRSAGRWLATPGRFFPGYGREIGLEELVAAAVEEAKASGGWCKVIGDWLPGDGAVPLELLTATAEAVHAIGGKVAVHANTSEGTRNAVLAGADSVEHARHLDPDLLDRMAAQGTAMTPTLTASAAHIDEARAKPSSVRRDWYVSGFDGMPALIRSAYEAGVTILAGTDSVPYGNVAAEIGLLRGAGLSAEAALGAASRTARSWLGLPGLAEGAPADLVAYRSDPAADPDVLGDPACVVLRGRVFKR